MHARRLSENENALFTKMGEAMRAAAENHKRFVVLDRPNPINGVEVSIAFSAGVTHIRTI